MHAISFDRELDSILHTKKPKQGVSVPDVPMDDGNHAEQEPMEQEETDKPQVTFLVSYMYMYMYIRCN